MLGVLQFTNCQWQVYMLRAVCPYLRNGCVERVFVCETCVPWKFTEEKCKFEFLCFVFDVDWASVFVPLFKFLEVPRGIIAEITWFPAVARAASMFLAISWYYWSLFESSSPVASYADALWAGFWTYDSTSKWIMPSFSASKYIGRKGMIAGYVTSNYRDFRERGPWPGSKIVRDHVTFIFWWMTLKNWVNQKREDSL